MKPNELTGNSDYCSHVATGRIYRKYKDKDCIVAYLKNEFGYTMCIKGEKKPFYFIHYTTNIWLGGFDYNMAKIEYNNFKDICSNNLIILDEEEWNKIQFKETEKMI